MTVARTYTRWPFIAVLLGVAAIALGSLAAFDTAPEIWQHITRYTARLSFLIFVIVFASGALAALFPSATTRWLRRNRRYTGLSFALAHFLHLIAIIGLFVTIEEVPELITIIGGGGAYVFIAAMALTSNDWSVRKLGPQNWLRLHPRRLVRLGDLHEFLCRPPRERDAAGTEMDFRPHHSPRHRRARPPHRRLDEETAEIRHRTGLSDHALLFTDAASAVIFCASCVIASEDVPECTTSGGAAGYLARVAGLALLGLLAASGVSYANIFGDDDRRNIAAAATG